MAEELLALMTWTPAWDSDASFGLPADAQRLARSCYNLFFRSVYVSNSSPGQFLSPACEHDRHEECRHVHGGPLPEAPESRFYICTCPCHQNCIMTPAQSDEVNPTSCTCPGMMALRKEDRSTRDRSRGESPVALLFWLARKARGERRARRAIHEILAASAPGMSRESARSMIVEEYQRHGLEPPSQPILDYKADLYRAQDVKDRELILEEMRTLRGEALSSLREEAKGLFTPPPDS